MSDRTRNHNCNSWILFLIAVLAIFHVPPAAQAGEPIRAHVLECADRWTHYVGAKMAVKSAGISAEDLPLKQSPEALETDLIVLGSFSSEHPDYDAYMKRFGADLTDFVRQGGVLIQLTQADQTEASPAFLPEGLTAVRCDTDLGDVRALQSDHPLLDGLLDERDRLELPFHFRSGPNWETFTKQKGFGVLLASDSRAHYPVLMEAKVGQGRLLLSSMFFDKLKSAEDDKKAPQEYHRLAKRFFQNLADYVRSVRSGQAPDVAVTEPYSPPAPLPWIQGSWTLAVLPDTQGYSMHHPELFEAQTRWIARHAEDHNIKYVLHLGDIVNNNNHAQWKNAARAMHILDGVVPYAMAPGNHDYGPNGTASTRETYLNDYFSLEECRNWPTFGGAMEEGRLDNTYHTFEAGGEKWLVLALEWGPRNKTVEWAGSVLAQHPDHRAILITHAYLYSDGTRYNWEERGKDQHWNPHAYSTHKLPGGVNDGQDLWEKLVSKHPNVMLTLNGHVLNDGQGRLTSVGEHGQKVHQILVNYQMKPRAGQGYLRLIEFPPDGEKMRFRTYSPVLDKYKTDAKNQFVLPVPPRVGRKEQ